MEKTSSFANGAPVVKKGKRQLDALLQSVAQAVVPDHHCLILWRLGRWPLWASPLYDVMQQVISVVTVLPASPHRQHQFMRYLEAVKAAWGRCHLFLCRQMGKLDDETYWAASSDQRLWGIEGLRNPTCQSACLHGDAFLRLWQNMEIHWTWNFKREIKSKKQHYTFISLVIYVKTGQVTFAEGNHHAIKLITNE